MTPRAPGHRLRRPARPPARRHDADTRADTLLADLVPPDGTADGTAPAVVRPRGRRAAGGA
ncbi:hypothetical protein [Kitasatospora terrestris]|uniref:Uncharacterized protein n=1 Tax=Kitasatospora terrestris TaxID=258051 RepID=A0ABP9DEV2_9ACTN